MRMWRVALGSMLALLASALAGQSAPLPSALEAGWQGQRVCELLYETASDRVLRCTFAPGVGHERHFHPAHFGYALSGGRMRISDSNGTREVHIATGSHFTSAGVDWHQVQNVGSTTVAYLMFEAKSGPGPRF